ncbi:MAG: hypothetical protein K2G38_03600 [Clostridia bacterium]|nr:hypothetical protein [Clostridia bacterium]
MKLYDFDGMFDEKLAEYVSKNAGKYKETEWEDIIPKLYKQFGDMFIKSVGDTPNGFYAKMTDAELVTALTTHLKKDVPVSEFLCSAIESRNAVELLLPLLDGTENERSYAMNLIGSDERAIKKYMQLLTSKDSSADLKDACVDFIKEKADLVINEAVENYKKGIEREYMLEIMSRTVIRSDEIFEILLKEFRTDPENLSMHASYLAAYGDERALEYLLEKIDEEGITFVEYRELKFAIAALGGEYEKERDFSGDPYFELIKSHSQNTADLFGSFDDKKN